MRTAWDPHPSYYRRLPLRFPSHSLPRISGKADTGSNGHTSCRGETASGRLISCNCYNFLTKSLVSGNFLDQFFILMRIELQRIFHDDPHQSPHHWKHLHEQWLFKNQIHPSCRIKRFSLYDLAGTSKRPGSLRKDCIFTEIWNHQCLKKRMFLWQREL